MMQQLRSYTMIGLAILIASCTVSMMYIFISGNAGGSDMRTLLVGQSLAIAPALLLFAVDLVRRWRTKSTGNIWRALPAWLLIALLLPNLLVIVGELSLFLRLRLTGAPIVWYEHAPLLCVMSCSLALCVLYARSRQDAPARVGRW